MKDKKHKKGGIRVGAGRKPSGRQKEAITLYVDVSLFGGKVGARMKLYELWDGVITDAGKKSFIPLDEKIFPPSDQEVKQSGLPLPKDYVKAKKIGAVKSDGTVIKDVTKPTSVLKPQEQPKSNFSINTAPRTIDELRALCPKELTGINRTIWLSEQKEKYGI